MTVLQIKGLYKQYVRKDAYAVKNISLEVGKGELLALIGESGSGKTTLLRLIAGFEQAERGEIIINNRIVAGNKTFMAPEKRKVGMVFQDYALFPHLTIFENISFGLSRLSKKEADHRTNEVMKLVGLQRFRKRYPHQLSGGQQQRTALARALAPNPSLILLDEPFSNLDGILKDQVREEVRKILKRARTTAIFVTHDTRDALSTADRIAVLKEGMIQQVGKPEEVYTSPTNIYVANFFGKINIINALAENEGFNSQIGFIDANISSRYQGNVVLAIRPENIILVDNNNSSLSAKVDVITYLGDKKLLAVIVNHQGKSTRLLLKAENDFNIKKGGRVYFKIDTQKIKVLDTCSGPVQFFGQ